MNTLLLLAALSSQITFNTTQQGDVGDAANLLI